MIAVTGHAIDRIADRNIAPEDILHALQFGRRFVQRGDHKIRHTAKTASGLICVLTTPDAKTIITVLRIKPMPGKKRKAAKFHE